MSSADLEKRRESNCNNVLSVLRNGELQHMTESLILAQNERWRRVLSMQVGRE